MAKKEDHGKIRRVSSTEVEVIASGFKDPFEGPGITCDNPTAEVSERKYRKVFTKIPIWLPHEYEKAVSTILGTGKDIVVLGMNGYSELSDDQCAKWGVKPGAYEAACESLLTVVTSTLMDQYPGIDIRFAHGASDLGVDRAIINVANRLNLPQLGHSCPQFMFWVEDNGIPVYVGKDQAAYADSFIDSLDILIAANGRLQAFKHDINAAFLKLKHVIPVNVLKSISETGGPPALGPDGHIEDAVAAFEKRVHLIATRLGFTRQDRWREIVEHVQETAVGICRSLISPERAFYLKPGTTYGESK